MISALLPLILFSGTGGCWYPAIFASFAENGFEGFVMTGLLSANLAIAGAACAVSLKLKNYLLELQQFLVLLSLLFMVF